MSDDNLVDVYDLGLEGLYSLRFELIIENENESCRENINEYVKQELAFDDFNAFTTFPKLLKEKCTTVVVLSKSCIDYDIVKLTSIVAHEASHLVDAIRDWTGIKYECEHHAYHVEYFTRKILNVLANNTLYKNKFVDK